MSNTANPRFRDIVAESVHQAVTIYTGSDGLGYCDLYSLAGMFLLREVTDRPYQIQLGSLMFLADPDGNGWFEINASDGGLDRLEYHAWIGLAGTRVTRDETARSSTYTIGEFIDFSVRHLRTMAEQMQIITEAKRIGEGFLLTLKHEADRIKWTRPDDAPLYLWLEGQPGQDYRYMPDRECMEAYYENLNRNPGLARDLCHLVLSRYRLICKKEQGT